MSATRRETRAQIPAKGQGVMATVWLFILATWRLGAVVFGLALCVSALAWKVSQLQFFNKDFLQGQGDNRAIRTIPIAANRGVIFDRNGEPLAVSTSVVTISVNPSKIIDNF